MINRIYVCVVALEMADQQRDQTEERAKKMKVVLVKTKKELSDAKKEIDEQKQHEAELKVQVEMLTQGNEEGKVIIIPQIGLIVVYNVNFTEASFNILGASCSSHIPVSSFTTAGKLHSLVCLFVCTGINFLYFHVN